MRYSRQVILPEIGSEGQKAIRATKVLCVGAGGLGCAALPYLAAAGVGQIGICDDDRVDVSNLQRQILYKTCEVGAPKAELAAANLRGLNPEVTVKVHGSRLGPDNALTLFPQYDIILDGSDNFPTKFLINDAAVRLQKPFVYGAVLGFEGQISVFMPGDGPCYRCLFGEMPGNPAANCVEAGVLGSFVGVMGAMQATECLKIAAKNPKLAPLTGRLLFLDARGWRIREFAVQKSRSCPTCSKKPEDIVLSMPEAPCATVPVPEITPKEAADLENVLFLDVREPHEWNVDRISGAVHLPLGSLLAESELDLPHEGEIVVYCRSGVRSKKALLHLQELGHANGKNLQGGYLAFEREYPARCERSM